MHGWESRSYDNLHPDILPPCPGAGGREGMRHLAAVRAERNFLFAVHDQYLDAASYDEALTARELNSVWA